MTNPANDRSDHDNESERAEALSAPDGGDPSETADAGDSDTERDTQGDDNTSSPSSEALSLADAQRRAEEAAKALLDHQFEGTIKAETPDGGGWRTVVEVVERSAIPSTQDIIGRYEIMFDTAGEVTGYELLERYRRNDMKEEL
ncbi:protein gvpO 1 [Halobellus salinus]|uniref:Protein gvpO 1 n=1 Tax=Halobellus salinus TaxID=931585 RepID=A0A830EFJ9_9EURY|nr:gas vesicle protein [Halobellus salinus]GGJ05460.1 protein gvpO 1 [Halobellus salinus]SMP23507.1 Gas vesicle synthesis protein GvpO [Halobellus salinus]